MKTLTAVASIATLLVSGVALASPQVTYSDPQVVVADAPGESTRTTVTLTGNGLMLPSTNGTNIDTDVQIYATAPGHSWQQVVRGGWAQLTGFSGDLLEVTVGGLPASGTLQFQICVRTQGCMAAYYNVPIRAYSTAAPRLYEPSGETFPPFNSSVGPNDSRRLTYFAADNLNPGAPCIYIEGGGYASIAFVDAGDGWGYFWMPNLAVGDHHIWISNHGCYAPHWSLFNTIHVGISWP